MIYAILIVFAFFFSCNKTDSERERIITFRVIPKVLPEDSKIYISGNTSQLGNWDPDDIFMEKTPDGSWFKTFSFDSGTSLEFKFTRGSWASEAVDEHGLEFPNLILNVTDDTTITFEVFNWRDNIQRETKGD